MGIFCDVFRLGIKYKSNSQNIKKYYDESDYNAVILYHRISQFGIILHL